MINNIFEFFIVSKAATKPILSVHMHELINVFCASIKLTAPIIADDGSPLDIALDKIATSGLIFSFKWNPQSL